MSLARIGKRTVLVDFDLPRPAVNNVFDLPLEPGICDVLRSDYSLEDVVSDVALPNLSVVTSGIADAASARYMNSARLAEVLDELREQFEYVIVDGSPLIPVADARVVSRFVDGAICCVLRDVSRLGLVRQAATSWPISRSACSARSSPQAGRLLPVLRWRPRTAPPVHRCLLTANVVGGSPDPRRAPPEVSILRAVGIVASRRALKHHINPIVT